MSNMMMHDEFDDYSDDSQSVARSAALQAIEAEAKRLAGKTPWYKHPEGVSEIRILPNLKSWNIGVTSPLGEFVPHIFHYSTEYWVAYAKNGAIGIPAPQGNDKAVGFGYVVPANRDEDPLAEFLEELQQLVAVDPRFKGVLDTIQVRTNAYCNVLDMKNPAQGPLPYSPPTAIRSRVESDLNNPQLRMLAHPVYGFSYQVHATGTGLDRRYKDVIRSQPFSLEDFDTLKSQLSSMNPANHGRKLDDEMRDTLAASVYVARNNLRRASGVTSVQMVGNTSARPSVPTGAVAGQRMFASSADPSTLSRQASAPGVSAYSKPAVGAATTPQNGFRPAARTVTPAAGTSATHPAGAPSQQGASANAARGFTPRRTAADMTGDVISD